MEQKCKTCNRLFIYKRNRGGTKDQCNSCSVNLRRIKLRKRIVEYLGGKCIRCGYSKCFGSMHAHHEDPFFKEFSISGAHCRSWMTIEKELDKCILICANCHGEEHHNCERYLCPCIGSLL